MQPDIVARRIGREREPVVVVDHFSAVPDRLRDAAISARFERADDHYPGIRALLPREYLSDQQPILSTVLREVFGCRINMRVLDAAFSIVTTAPDALSTEQRLPHVDAVDAGRIALVHYLSPEEGDGTGFFRHRATGFETIDETRAPVYFERLAKELSGCRLPARYINDDTELFERTALIEPRFNRAVIYRGALLHSGAIRPDASLTGDPVTGRLTITAFLSAS